jgi:tRNA-binding protein
MNMITYEDFCRVELRVGVVVKAEPFPRANKPAYKVWVDFGPDIGIKQTSAQITHHYTLADLPGRQVIGCVNLSPRNIAGFQSEFLLTGFADEQGFVCLATVNQKVPMGQKLH